MESVLYVVQSLSISLGVGCSTVAIVSYLATVGKKLDRQTSRYMMGIVFILLRVAMGLILLTTASIAVHEWLTTGLITLTTYSAALWLFIFVLYINAVLMTLHLMPRSIGPGLQAATWYALGISAAMPAALTTLSFGAVLIYYIAFLSAVEVLINTVVAIERN